MSFSDLNSRDNWGMISPNIKLYYAFPSGPEGIDYYQTSGNRGTQYLIPLFNLTIPIRVHHCAACVNPAFCL